MPGTRAHSAVWGSGEHGQSPRIRLRWPPRVSTLSKMDTSIMEGSRRGGHSSGAGRQVGGPRRHRPARAPPPRAALTVRISPSSTRPTARAWVMWPPTFERVTCSRRANRSWRRRDTAPSPRWWDDRSPPRAPPGGGDAAAPEEELSRGCEGGVDRQEPVAFFGPRFDAEEALGVPCGEPYPGLRLRLCRRSAAASAWAPVPSIGRCVPSL